MRQSKKVFITGASGFLGSFVANDLLKNGYEVDAYVRNIAKASNVLPKEINLIHGDLEDESSIKSSLKKQYDAILHIGAIRNAWGIPREKYHNANVKSTKWILEAIEEMGSQFIYCSSALVAPIYRPTLYTRFKLESESIINEFINRKKIKAVILRPSILYGAEDPKGTVCNLCRVLLNGSYKTIGSGKNRLVLTHVKDVSKAFIKSIGNESVTGKTLIVADTPGIEVNDYVKKVARILDVEVPSLKIPKFIGFTVGSVLENIYSALSIKKDPVIDVHKVDMMTANHEFDITEAQKYINFNPTVNFDDGLADNIKYFHSLPQ